MEEGSQSALIACPAADGNMASQFLTYPVFDPFQDGSIRALLATETCPCSSTLTFSFDVNETAWFVLTAWSGLCAIMR